MANCWRGQNNQKQPKIARTRVKENNGCKEVVGS